MHYISFPDMILKKNVIILITLNWITAFSNEANACIYCCWFNLPLYHIHMRAFPAINTLCDIMQHRELYIKSNVKCMTFSVFVIQFIKFHINYTIVLTRFVKLCQIIAKARKIEVLLCRRLVNNKAPVSSD